MGSWGLIIYPILCIVPKHSLCRERLERLPDVCAARLSPGSGLGFLSSCPYERYHGLSPYHMPGLPSSASFIVKKLHRDGR